MRRSLSQKLSTAQVERINARRKSLALTREQLLEKFSGALKCVTGQVQSTAAAKMRLDRIFNDKMRCPLTDTTKAALAHALDWSVAEFEDAISEATMINERAAPLPASANKVPRSARQVAHCVAVQLETHQISRGVNLRVDNLLKVYSAAHRMFLHIRDLMEEMPVDDFYRDPVAQEIYDVLLAVLNENLRPHLTVWADRYRSWDENSLAKDSGVHLTAQQLQLRFPDRKKLEQDLCSVSCRLQADAARLRVLITQAYSEKNQPAVVSAM